MYDEFAAALQFPYYFGNNANAFDECLADMSWLRGSIYVLTILDSAELLGGEPSELQPFLDAFERISVEWSKPIEKGESWDRPAVPFHFVFHFIADDIERLHRRIATAPCINK
jgi:hypothetical protein